MASDSSSLSKTTINWDPSWQELDLTFGIAINRDGSEQLLEPADYGVTPDGGIQFADVILLGSDSTDRVYASIDSHINTKGGNDVLFSTDDQTGNQIIGGTGSDTFYLQTTNNSIIGGDIFDSFDSHNLSGLVALADFEADTYLIESSSESIPLNTFLKIQDFEASRDTLMIDGFKVDTFDWATARELLGSKNIDINATPKSALERITISLLEGVSSEIDLAPYIFDPDDDELRVLKLNGPDWIAISGTVLTANTPIGTSENDLKTIELQIGYTDEKAVVPFAVNLTLNNAPTALELTSITTSLAENIDTSQPIKLADIGITDDALGTNIITLSGNDAAVFELSGNTLLLKAGTSLDFETKSSYNINVNVADPDLTTSTPISTPFSLTLTDVNEPPTALELTDVTTSLAENTDTSQPIKLADIDITDDALGTNIITLSGDDAAVFEVSGNALLLKAGTTLDFETKSSYNININVADPNLTTSTPISTPFSLTLIDVNETPTEPNDTQTDSNQTQSPTNPDEEQVPVENTAPVTVTRNAENNATRLTITPSTGENAETLIVDPTTLEVGDQPIFEVQDGVSNSAPIAISFNLIEELTTPINLNTATEGGGTIASNAPSGIDLSFNGVYFNSAAGSDEITGSSFDDFIRAGAGDDIVNTGAGNDLIRSGAGNDIITTGDGDDLIYYTADQLDGTTDRVLDFSASDRIVLGENIRASLSGNIATFTTTIDGVDRLATLSLEGSSVVFDEIFITPT